MKRRLLPVCGLAILMAGALATGASANWGHSLLLTLPGTTTPVEPAFSSHQGLGGPFASMMAADVAVDADGNCHVVWTHRTTPQGIQGTAYYQKYTVVRDSSGNPIRWDLTSTVTAPGASDVSGARLAVDNQRRPVVVLEGANSVGGPVSVRIWYPQTGQVALMSGGNGFVADSKPAIARTPSGQFVVAWVRKCELPEGETRAIACVRFSADTPPPSAPDVTSSQLPFIYGDPLDLAVDANGVAHIRAWNAAPLDNSCRDLPNQTPPDYYYYWCNIGTNGILAEGPSCEYINLFSCVYTYDWRGGHENEYYEIFRGLNMRIDYGVTTPVPSQRRSYPTAYIGVTGACSRNTLYVACTESRYRCVDGSGSWQEECPVLFCGHLSDATAGVARWSGIVRFLDDVKAINPSAFGRTWERIAVQPDTDAPVAALLWAYNNVVTGGDDDPGTPRLLLKCFDPRTIFSTAPLPVAQGGEYQFGFPFKPDSGSEDGVYPEGVDPNNNLPLDVPAIFDLTAQGLPSSFDLSSLSRWDSWDNNGQVERSWSGGLFGSISMWTWPGEGNYDGWLPVGYKIGLPAGYTPGLSIAGTVNRGDAVYPFPKAGWYRLASRFADPVALADVRVQAGTATPMTLDEAQLQGYVDGEFQYWQAVNRSTMTASLDPEADDAYLRPWYGYWFRVRTVPTDGLKLIVPDPVVVP